MQIEPTNDAGALLVTEGDRFAEIEPRKFRLSLPLCRWFVWFNCEGGRATIVHDKIDALALAAEWVQDGKLPDGH